MAEYLTPGIYTEKVDASVPSIAGISSDVAAFVGIAQSGPLDTPVPVESFRQFQSHFGGFIGGGYLAYTVRAFFENGGRRCWVVRVAAKHQPGGSKAAAVVLRNTKNKPALYITASSPGIWGNNLSIAVRAQFLAETVSNPVMSSDRYATVVSVTGFVRGSLVRISQPGVEAWRIISLVDGNRKRIYWMHPEPGAGLIYDRPISGFDFDLPLHIAELTYAIDVWRYERFVDRYSAISLISEHPNYAPRVLPKPEYPTTLNSPNRLQAAARSIVIETPAESLDNSIDFPYPLQITDGMNLPLTGGADGLALLRVVDFTGLPVDSRDSDTVKAVKTRGIRALDLVDEIAIVAVPDILIQPIKEPEYEIVNRTIPDPCISCPPAAKPLAPPNQPKRSDERPPSFSDNEIYQVQAALIQHCEERRDRIALLDSPFNTVQDDALGIGAVQAWRTRFETYYAALYYPWIRVTDPLHRQIVRQIPACGHVAGQYAVHDIETGVHKAPANRLLIWIQDISKAVSFQQHALLNPLGINIIRADAGRGLRIMGARTLSNDPDWRYVNVRRLIIMIMKAIELSTQWAVFEPNNFMTRSKIRLALSEFLTALWQKGALTGSVAEQAFFVKCDESNNSPEQRANGRLIAEIGVAPSKPFEFVIIRVGRQGNTLEIAELTDLARVA